MSPAAMMTLAIRDLTGMMLKLAAESEDVDSASQVELTEAPRDHVFTLHAELEGQKLAPIFEELLTGWQAQGYDLVSMADYYKEVKSTSLRFIRPTGAICPAAQVK